MLVLEGQSCRRECYMLVFAPKNCVLDRLAYDFVALGGHCLESRVLVISVQVDGIYITHSSKHATLL